MQLHVPIFVYLNVLSIPSQSINNSECSCD